MNKALLLVALVAAVVVAALGVYFVSNNSGTPSTNPSPSATNPHPGAALYVQYCASCHGDLTSSARKGYTATAIQNAIATVPGKQASLGSLTATQIQEIADALKLP